MHIVGCRHVGGYDPIHIAPDWSRAEAIQTYGWMAFVAAFGGILIHFIALMCTHLAAFRTAENIRKRGMKRLMYAPLGYFDNNPSGLVRNRLDGGAAETETLLAPRAVADGNFVEFVADFAFYAVFSAIISTALAKVMFATSGLMMAQTALDRIRPVTEAPQLTVTDDPKMPEDNRIEFKGVTFIAVNLIVMGGIGILYMLMVGFMGTLTNGDILPGIGTFIIATLIFIVLSMVTHYQQYVNTYERASEYRSELEDRLKGGNGNEAQILGMGSAVLHVHDDDHRKEEGGLICWICSNGAMLAFSQEASCSLPRE